MWATQTTIKTKEFTIIENNYCALGNIPDSDHVKYVYPYPAVTNDFYEITTVKLFQLSIIPVVKEMLVFL